MNFRAVDRTLVCSVFFKIQTFRIFFRYLACKIHQIPQIFAFIVSSSLRFSRSRHFAKFRASFVAFAR
jgi:hypothetical protein